jgi:glycine/D-amino acid oxidase-like deaminating enzyme
MHVVVIGAGAFGAWTALWLRRRGASVTLVEQYAPGNALSSSGDESRVTRSAHGADEFYPRWQRRALRHWTELAPELVVQTGVVWLASRADGFEADSLTALNRLDIPAERLDPDVLGARYPQMTLDGVEWALFEPEGGAILARRAVALVARTFENEGGELRIGRARVSGETVSVDTEPVQANSIVFAAGSWLPALLGPVRGLELRVTQQEVIYIATPPGDDRFSVGSSPTWVEHGAAFYGLPSIEGRGFKIAPDWPGPSVDPDRQERRLSDGQIAAARKYLSRRFPALADQPVAEGRVCQYESTPDQHFIVDRHPTLEGAWVVGGGSGHGFKHAPVIGEYVAALVAGDQRAVAELAPPDDRFALRPRITSRGMRTLAVAPDPR